MGLVVKLLQLLWKAMMEDRAAPHRPGRQAPKTAIPIEPLELTPEQKALLPVWREKWLKIGLSTEPIDRLRAEAAIKKAYAPIKPPASLFICDSPLSAGLVTLALQGKPIEGLRAAVGESVWNSAQASLRQNQRRDSGKCIGGGWGAFSYPLLLQVSKAVLRDDCRNEFIDIHDPRWTQAANDQLDGKGLRHLLDLDYDREFGETLVGVKELGNVWSTVTKLDNLVTEAFSDLIAQGMRSYLMAQPRLERLVSEILLQGNRDFLLKPGTRVWELRKAVPGIAWRALLDSSTELHRWGLDTPWLPHCDYLWRVIGLESLSNLEGLIDLAQCCGWWAPYEHIAILQHRPCEIHLDEDGNLDNSNGMVVKYRDGWEVHYHGKPTQAA